MKLPRPRRLPYRPMPYSIRINAFRLDERAMVAAIRAWKADQRDTDEEDD